MKTETPEQKAEMAAEALAAEGQKVSARSVRERAKVSMKVALEAARAWNTVATQSHAAPAIPDTVMRRLEAVWRDAFAAAQAEFEASRTGWEAAIARAEDQATELAAVVEEIEQEKDRMHAKAREVAQQADSDLAAARVELTTERSRADKAEGALVAVTAERDRLLVDLRAAQTVKLSARPAKLPAKTAEAV